MEIEPILKKAGLTENEAKVYKRLITIGESTASRLGKETGMERRTVYDIVNKLLEKGLISFIEKDEKKFYRPLSPLKFLDILNEKEEELRDTRQEFVKMIPNLENLVHSADEKVDVRLLRGKEGIKALFMDEIKEGKQVYYAICTATDRIESLLKNFLPRFTKERISKGIKIKMISVKRDRKYLSKYKLLEAKYLSEDLVSPASIVIYRNKLGIILWSDEPIVVLVKNEEISKAFLNYFNLMWKIAEK